MSVLNEENDKTIDFIIITSVVNTIEMIKIKEYIEKGSSNLMPGKAFQALETILKNSLNSLR